MNLPIIKNFDCDLDKWVMQLWVNDQLHEIVSEYYDIAESLAIKIARGYRIGVVEEDCGCGEVRIIQRM